MSPVGRVTTDRGAGAEQADGVGVLLRAGGENDDAEHLRHGLEELEEARTVQDGVRAGVAELGVDERLVFGQRGRKTGGRV